MSNKSDPYVYEGTDVLINKLNIQDNETLKVAEGTLFYFKSLEPLPAGNLDYVHLKAIHHHFFSEIYEWAGKERTVSIAKANSLFAFPQHIAPMLNKLFAELKNEQYLTHTLQSEFSHRLSYYFNELNAAHPFREGNGRTQRAFCDLIAQNAGYRLDWKQVSENEYLKANLCGFLNADYEPMADLFKQILTPSQRQMIVLKEEPAPTLTNTSIEKLSHYVQKQVELTELIQKKQVIQSTQPPLSKELSEQVVFLGNEVRQLAKELIAFEDIQTILNTHTSKPYVISLSKQGGFSEIHRRFQKREIQTKDILAVLRFAKSQAAKLSQQSLSQTQSVKI